MEFLKYINFLSETLPFIFLLVFYKRITSKDKRIFFAYALLTSILIILVITFLYVINNRDAYIITARTHTVIEFSLLTYLFSISLKNKAIKKIALFAIIPFFLLCVFDYISTKNPSIAYIPLLTECLFFIILILYFFFEKIRQDPNEALFATFLFWFAVAFLINFSGNFLLFVYSETSNKEPDFKVNYTIIYCTVTIVKNILLCIAVTMKESVTIKDNINDKMLHTFDPVAFYPDKN